MKSRYEKTVRERREISCPDVSSSFQRFCPPRHILEDSDPVHSSWEGFVFSSCPLLRWPYCPEWVEVLRQAVGSSISGEERTVSK